MKVILAFDSFKGSMSAHQAVVAATEGVQSVCPDAEVIGLPLADGGEGTTDALCRYMDATWHSCLVHDALMRVIEARYAISSDGKTAIMDMASAAGLVLLEETERNPMLTTTYGVGEMILDAKQKGCRHILLGIGGSATNDAGIGVLSALGATFFDSENKELSPVGGNLTKIARIDASGMKDVLLGITVDVICDVSNPLFGNNGAAFVYAKQKGAFDSDVEELDKGLRNFAQVMCAYGWLADANTAGAGAAGGLGYGLLLLGATLKKGVDVVLDAANLNNHLIGADIVFTGEGKADSQTLNGKLPYGLLKRAQQAGVPVVVFAGLVEDKEQLVYAGFQDVISINPPFISQMDVANVMKPSVAMEKLRMSIRHYLKLFTSK